MDRSRIAPARPCGARQAPLRSRRPARQRIRILRTRFDEQRRAARPQRTDGRGQARLVFDGAQRRAVGEFHGGHRCALQPRDGAAGGPEIVEEDQCARLVGVLGYRAIGDLADESERAFGADHQVREHVDRILEVDQRIQAVARRVLHSELVPDARRERSLSRARRASASRRAHEIALLREKRGAACRVARIEHRAVGEHDAHARQRVIAVLRGSAAHSARVVGGDAADHRRVDRRRVGTDLAAERRRAGRLATAPITPGCSEIDLRVRRRSRTGANRHRAAPAPNR